MEPYRKRSGSTIKYRHYYYRRRQHRDPNSTEKREPPGQYWANNVPGNQHTGTHVPPLFPVWPPTTYPVRFQPNYRPDVPPLAALQQPRWRLLSDPYVSNNKKNVSRIFRNDGAIPRYNHPLYHDLIIEDRRRMARFKNKTATWPPMVLPLPAFANNSRRSKFEVTLTNLPDTIDKRFLSYLIGPCGKIELIQIFYHPVTKKQLGLAKIIFFEERAACLCVQKLNNKTVMGKTINAFLDPHAKHCLMLYQQLIERKPNPPFQLQKVDKSCLPKLNNHTNSISDYTSTAAEIKCNNTTDTYAIDNNKTFSNSFNRYPLSSEESISINSSTSSIAVPAPAPPEFDFETSLRVDINTKIKKLLSNPNVNSAMLSLVDNGCNDVPNSINDCINLTFSRPLSPSTSLIAVPATAPPELNFETPLRVDLDTRIKMLLSSPTADSACVSTVNNGCADVPNTINDDFNSKCPSPIKSSTSLKAMPAHVPPKELDFETKLSVNLDTRIKMLLSSPTADSACVSTVNNGCADVPNTINDGFNLTFSSPVKSSTSLIDMPAPALPEKLDFETKLEVDLDTRIKMLLNSRSADPDFVSTTNIDCADVLNAIDDDFNLTFSLPSDSYDNLVNSVILGCETELPPLSNPPSPFLSKEVYLKCYETESSLNSKIQSVTSNTLDLHSEISSSSDDENSTKKNSTVKIAETNQNYLYDFNCPPPFNNYCDYQYVSDPSNYDLTLLNVYDKEQPCNEHGDKNLPTKLKKNLMKADHVLKHDFVNNVLPDIACNVLDQWLDETGSQFKPTDVTYKESKSIKPAPFIKDKKTSGLSDLSIGLGAVIPKITSNVNDGMAKSTFPKKEGSLLKYKRHGAVKRKIDFENFKKPVYSPPPLPDWESNLDTTDVLDTVFKNQTVDNTSKIEDRPDQLVVPSHCNDQLQTKHFKKQDVKQKKAIEFLTKEISNKLPSKMNKSECKVHKPGCARTEGFYIMDNKQKTKKKYHSVQKLNTKSDRIKEPKRAYKSKGKMSALSREACNNSNQLQLLSTPIELSDLQKFQKLNFRKKKLKCGKSPIHNLGLFAMEPIAADEMVIENVGQNIRLSVGDARKRNYEAAGLSNSYLFKIDSDTVIDSTKCGNLARFINHSCDPNCYSKVIQIEGKKKIIIYSKQPISVDEEITIDYLCPLEEKKVLCLCGAHCCRGTIN